MLDFLRERMGREPHREGLNPVSRSAMEYWSEYGPDDPYGESQPTAGFANRPYTAPPPPSHAPVSEQPPVFSLDQVMRMVSEIRGLLDSQPGGFPVSSGGSNPVSSGYRDSGLRQSGTPRAGGKTSPGPSARAATGGGVQAAKPAAASTKKSRKPRRRPTGGRDIKGGGDTIHRSPYGF